MLSHNNQRKIAVINDLTGFGRCALTVAIPVISAMKVQCCPVPTSILSNHTAFDSCFIDDYTDKMEPYINEWKKLGLKFNGIYSGFLGSKAQIAIVARLFEAFKTEDNLIIIDPVMGDNGKPYRTYTPQMCREMKRLIRYADILTPNVTEACILTDTPYKTQWTEQELKLLAGKLAKQGPKKIIITGVDLGEAIGNYSYATHMATGAGRLLTIKKAGESRCGTGDLFTSIIAADAVNGADLQASVKKAAGFVADCIRASEKMEIPLTDGVCFEELLGKLIHSSKS